MNAGIHGPTDPGSLELSIVVPVYNEPLNIEPTLQQLHDYVKLPHEVLVVYDMDEDTTLPVVRRLMATYPTVRLVKNTVCRGPSGALRAGFAAARAPRVAVVMADQSDNLSQIDELASLVPGRADIACPSRYGPGGVNKMPGCVKVYAPRTTGRLLHMLTGMGTYDPTFAYKVYSAEVLRAFPMTSTVSFSVTLEIVAKAHCLGYRIAEIPTSSRPRPVGHSNFPLARSLLCYLPWFFVMFLNNRLFRLPRPWLRRLFHAPAAEKGSAPR